MEAEVIAVGSELLLGQIIDTNSAVIARHFAGIGLNLFYKTTVGDNLGRVAAVIRQALGRSDVVVTTGGIGPTADDITREAVAEATGRQLVFSEHLMRQIETFFAVRGFRLSESNRRQAYIPEGAIPVENPVGTAPAFIVEHHGKTVITLPGVPREMEHLLTTRAIPYLRDRYGIKGEIKLRVLKVVGLGESRIGERLVDFMEKGRNPTIGTLAHLGQVDVRIAAKGTDSDDAERLIAPVEAEIRQRLGETIFGADGDTLESVIAARLALANAQVAVADLGGAGTGAARLAAGLPERFAGATIVGDPGSLPAHGLDVPPAGEPLARAKHLAASVARRAAVDVGAAIWFQDVAGSTPAVTRVGVAVAARGTLTGQEYTFGGDRPSMRIRGATLLLDEIRRALPAAGGR